MNAFHELLARHRSIRKYRPDPVPEDLLERILGAAARASTSGNMQPYSVIVTTDPALRRELHPLHFGQDLVLEAPVLLTFCSDFHRMRGWLAVSEAPDNFDNFMSFMIGTIDATLAAQNAALAAEAEGLGICFLGTTLASCDGIARALHCPPHVVPVAGFTLGYPAETPEVRDRLPLAGIVHRERYRDYSPAALLEIYRSREETGWKRYREVPELRRRVDEAGARNLAQVYTRVKYTRESHLRYSADVLECLRRQGFLGSRAEPARPASRNVPSAEKNRTAEAR